jgi:polyisoprenoid-binding protein YceI
MGISVLRGKFTKTSGKISLDRSAKTGTIDIAIDPASIDFGHAKLNEHVKGKDMFDVEKFPTITYKSKAIKFTGDHPTSVEGDLTMLGVTKPVTLTGEYASPVKDPWGNQRAAVNVSATINRKDWGLEWNTALETGGFLLSNDVKLAFEVQAVAEAAAA